MEGYRRSSHAALNDPQASSLEGAESLRGIFRVEYSNMAEACTGMILGRN